MARRRTRKLDFEGTVYRVTVAHDDEDVVTIRLETSRPPRGLDTVLYRWQGRSTALPLPSSDMPKETR